MTQATCHICNKTGEAPKLAGTPKGTRLSHAKCPWNPSEFAAPYTEMTYQHISKFGKPNQVLSSLIRPCLVPSAGHELLVNDYAGIEARGVAWCAGEEELLTQFAVGADIYCNMATRIFNRQITKKDKDERNVGKVTILGCGYGMGGPKFAATCVKANVDLAAVGLKAAQVIEVYRDTYPLIAGRVVDRSADGRAYRRGGLWKGYQNAVWNAVEKGEPGDVGKCHIWNDKGHLIITLPSGRELVYRKAAIEEKVPNYCKTLGLPEIPKPTVTYANPKGFRGDLYGGKITENIVQAICRDLMAEALVRLEDAGLRPVGHVHDEVICEVPTGRSEEHLAAVQACMVHTPKWARGFPIKVEGFCAPRYVKEPWTTWVQQERTNAE